ncbi:UvrD-helicase domain-containing protein [Phytohabitans aurantiacus]|uniref:DNA helicase n=1 Tax=Phytohabitans aurantiacus TaxID=3016789 RepID=A0ABQ5QUI8_9ACTN|nr:UvrD-helicase domain-containing protein [Phytohabitans aurantiacus]GLH97379.1 DNA helicase [Phytohabitans aurantiacus]
MNRPKHPPTGEQRAVIDDFRDGESLVVVAVAGAGKTTTLRLAAEEDQAANPGRRGLYVAYNAPLAKEARGAFPASVDCRTAHSLAFATHGRDLAHRIGAPRMTGKQAAEVMFAGGRYRETKVLNGPVEVAADVILTPGQMARLALDTVERYCQSDADQIGPQHVPAVNGIDGRHARDAFTSLVVPIAELAWKDLTHPRGRLRFQPDIYLKMWALSKPRISSDFILFDEAQDANPVLSAVLRAQAHTQLVAVGDPYQQLYAWRGAVDALATWPADRRLTLAQSFRFGPAVAERANEWLRLLGAEQRVIGFDRIASTVAPLDQADALLCRSNAGAMARVMDHVEAGRKVHLVGGASEIKRFAQAALRLMDGKRADHPELVAFDSWEAVREYAALDDGAQLATIVKLIDDHGPDKIVKVADSLASETGAEVTVSTAHKSKGRQWGTVQVAPDFKEPFPRPWPDRDSGRYALVLDAAELMLLYVTVTRAVDILDDFSTRWVERLHDHGVPVVVRGAPGHGIERQRIVAKVHPPAAIMPDVDDSALYRVDPDPSDQAGPFGAGPAKAEPPGPALAELIREAHGLASLTDLCGDLVDELYELADLDEPGDLPPLPAPEPERAYPEPLAPGEYPAWMTTKQRALVTHG